MGTTFVEFAGLQLSTEDSEATVAVDADERHLNGAGSVHGGLLATLADTAMGAALATTTGEGERPATVSLTMTYLEPAPEGRLTARGRLTRRGKRVTVPRAQVQCGRGALW